MLKMRLLMILTGIKFIFYIFLSVALAFSGGVFAILIYLKVTETNATLSLSKLAYAQTTQSNSDTPIVSKAPPTQEKLPSVILDAPVIKQYPELFNGCEITTLAMLLQYYGIIIGKMELVPQMNFDPTPLQLDRNGNVVFWGNPDTGFVGDITGRNKGFGIYAASLDDLLLKYIPSGMNLTGKPFSMLEQQIAKGIPVIAWTTVNFKEPEDDQWITWNSPDGFVKTTFQEHTVLLVGYDEKHVYVNDPLQGTKKLQIEKEQFIKSWNALGRQALSYNENK